MRRIAQILFGLLCLGGFSGCERDRYHVILVVDAKSYRPGMPWSQIREAGFADKTRTGMRAELADGNALQLYRFMHSSGGLMPLDEPTPHFSTPLILEKKITKFVLVLERPGSPPKKRTVDVSAMVPRADKDDPLYARQSYYVLSVDLP